MINIAVLGYGTIGSGVVEVIETNHESINRKIGEPIRVKYVLDKRDLSGTPVASKAVTDYDIILNDDDVSIVVEVLGGVELHIRLQSRRWSTERALPLPTRNW